MRKLKPVVAVIVLMSPIAAVQADVIRVDYTATVDFTSGTGFGYISGDIITGWFEYNSDDLCSTTICFLPVESNTGDGGLDDEKDVVITIQNAVSDFFLISDSTGSYDLSYILDADDQEIGYVETWANFQHYIEAGLINNFYSNNGEIREFLYTVTCIYGEDCVTEYLFDNTAAFAGISYTTTTVPEPGTLALLSLGLLGVGLTRRRMRA